MSEDSVEKQARVLFCITCGNDCKEWASYKGNIYCLGCFADAYDKLRESALRQSSGPCSACGEMRYHAHDAKPTSEEKS